MMVFHFSDSLDKNIHSISKTEGNDYFSKEFCNVKSSPSGKIKESEKND
jgi:hypothetical protein